tara:strand:+ start:337 stop:867 length:531 start_codon:yes stop_codon:yes gene_type:complete
MKNNLLFFLTATILVSCSTYNYQSNSAEVAIYELKTEPIEALFTERKYTKGSHTLKFYIHDLDDSTFQCNNIQIYDSTLAGELEAVESDLVRDSLYRPNIHSRNEIHIDINRQCTNKNSQIYLETNEIVKLQSYNLTRQRQGVTKRVKTFLIIYFSLSLIASIGIVIWLNSLLSGW